MEISNKQSWYVNPNTRYVTSNVKNTAIKDREAFNGSMQNLLNPVEDLAQVLKTPIKLADRSSLNRQSNSINIASGMRIAVNDGHILTVKPQGVEVFGGDNPYDTEAYLKAQKMAGSLATLLRNACGNMNTVAYSQEEYACTLSNHVKNGKRTTYSISAITAVTGTTAITKAFPT